MKKVRIPQPTHWHKPGQPKFYGLDCPHPGNLVKVGNHKIMAGAIRYLTPLETGKADLVIPLNQVIVARLGQKINILACPWADYDPPPIDFNRFLKEEVIPQLENRKKILVYCTGGHGRTGTFVASLISILEPEISDPILEIRKRYCKQAVETFAQAESIFALRGMELPQRYGEEFFTEREYWGLPNF